MQIKDKQVVYHDWESGHYDDKWSISFDERCIDYAAGRYLRAVPDGRAYGDVLEVGCGTGFFLLNLWQAGFAERLFCTDISAGMVEQCVANGRRLGVPVEGEVADAEALPFDDGRFDLVVAHAVIHHLPDLDTAFKELGRVLRPGGRLVVAGEPTIVGDRVASWVKRGARIGVKLAAVAFGARRVLADGVGDAPADPGHAAGYEDEVDLHTFDPAELEAIARDAGLVDVRCETEELTANWFGWLSRTVEGMVRPELVPSGYPWVAYRTWQRLFALDETLRGFVPRQACYNAVVTGVVPAGPR